jgi:hypothetical protein
MKKDYCTPELEIASLRIHDVLLYSTNSSDPNENPNHGGDEGEDGELGGL